MKELEYLNIINKTLSNSSYLGDDCANLKEFGLVVTQDSLVENVHFTLKTTTAKELGYKSIAVNLSDIAAAAALPKYITIALSIPKYIDTAFVQEFYDGVNEICVKNDVVIVGGDITGGESFVISICAMGEKISDFCVSRKNAKVGDIVVTTGVHGSSAAGLELLKNNNKIYPKIISAHLTPRPQIEAGTMLAQNITRDIATMDSSDGLCDALFKIATASDKSLKIDFDAIPFDLEIIEIALKYSKNHRDWVLWGGEDYELIACVAPSDFEKLDKNVFIKIGEVIEKKQNKNVIINFGIEEKFINEDVFFNKSFNHFEVKND